MLLKQFLAKSASMETDEELKHKIMNELPQRDSSFNFIMKVVCYVLVSVTFFMSDSLNWSKTVISSLLPTSLPSFQTSLILALLFTATVLTLLIVLIHTSDD